MAVANCPFSGTKVVDSRLHDYFNTLTRVLAARRWQPQIHDFPFNRLSLINHSTSPMDDAFLNFQ